MGTIFDEAVYSEVFDGFARRTVQGLCVAPAGELLFSRRLLLEKAAAARLPVIYPYRDYVEDNGLISYGADLRDNFRKSAGYVVRVLNGEKPGDLPVQQPTLFECLVNLRTAKGIGITIPETIMIRATEVIE
jgi:putative tryptophan/tyrosine transport system substrate-binding protein